MEFYRYSRAFRQPLKTRHGIWAKREGILLKLTDADGKAGWGEIAPLPWFGTETVEAAWRFLTHLPTNVASLENLSQTIAPNDLPCCQFGLETAWECLHAGKPQSPALDLTCSQLLSAGQGCLTEWRSLWQAGGRVFKWKIGVYSPIEELMWLQQLLEAMPPEATLRLDANGGLSLSQAEEWLECCDRLGRVEFLEQPLSPPQFAEMLALSRNYRTPIALDESVATVEQLENCYEKGWRAIFVVKPAIAGSPRRLRQFCCQSQADVVWSSALETAIGQSYIKTRLIPSVPQQGRAIGFGVDHWLEDTVQVNSLENEPIKTVSMAVLNEW